VHSPSAPIAILQLGVSKSVTAYTYYLPLQSPFTPYRFGVSDHAAKIQRTLENVRYGRELFIH
jgi:hypothetical protein